MLIPVMLGISIIVFVLARVIPGDPVRLALGEAATAQSIDALRHEMGLDKPIYEQYWIYFKGLLRGDLGRSIRTNQPVLKDLKTHFPATLELTLVAMVFTVVLAIPLGILSAVKRNSLVDHISRVIALAGVSMPIFWLGLILIYLFYYLLDWAPPPTGRLSILSRPPATITGLYLIDSLLAGNFSLFLECIKFLLMPAFCLATWSFAMLLRMTRSGMLEVLGEDYIRTARAKGLPTRVVVSKHALKNAIIPLLTVFGIIFGVLLNGAVLTETIFSWPGMGRYVVESISWLDYSPIQGMALFASVIYTLVNLIVDILYSMVDPRIRLFVPQ
jgi:peptide/nickel transport system permease protein